MFYIGVCIDTEAKQCCAVVVEKVLFRVKKELHVVHTETLWQEAGDRNQEATLQSAAISGIQRLYSDSRFQRMKKVFSQSKRPPKVIIAPPTVVVITDEKFVTQSLRRQKTPVNAICFRNEALKRVEDIEYRRMGYDLFVSVKDLLAACMKHLNVRNEAKTIVLQQDQDITEALLNEIAQGISNRVEGETNTQNISFPTTFNHKTLTTAFFAALFHAEKIREVKRY